MTDDLDLARLRQLAEQAKASDPAGLSAVQPQDGEHWWAFRSALSPDVVLRLIAMAEHAQCLELELMKCQTRLSVWHEYAADPPPGTETP